MKLWMINSFKHIGIERKNLRAMVRKKENNLIRCKWKEYGSEGKRFISYIN
jgi:hypothetical protein